MKHVIKFIMLLVIASGYSQTDNGGQLNLEQKSLHNVKISVSVNSAEDVKSTFEYKDIEELIDLVEPNESLNFEIICKGKTEEVGDSTSLTYTVKGNSNHKNDFIMRIKKVKEAAIKYYNNKS